MNHKDLVNREVKTLVKVPCQYRHPNIFCLKYGCHCGLDEVKSYPECPQTGQQMESKESKQDSL